MAEYRQEEGVDVAWNHVVAPLHERPRPRRALEGETAANGSTVGNAFDVPRRPHEVDDPAEDELVDVHLFDRRTQRLDVVRVDLRLQACDRMAVALRDDDLDLLVLRRIPERGTQREAVELRLRQRERPF